MSGVTSAVMSVVASAPAPVSLKYMPPAVRRAREAAEVQLQLLTLLKTLYIVVQCNTLEQTVGLQRVLHGAYAASV